MSKSETNKMSLLSSQSSDDVSSRSILSPTSNINVPTPKKHEECDACKKTRELWTNITIYSVSNVETTTETYQTSFFSSL